MSTVPGTPRKHWIDVHHHIIPPCTMYLAAMRQAGISDPVPTFFCIKLWRGANLLPARVLYVDLLMPIKEG